MSNLELDVQYAVLGARAGEEIAERAGEKIDERADEGIDEGAGEESEQGVEHSSDLEKSQLPSEAQLSRWAEAALLEAKGLEQSSLKPVSLSIRIVSSDESQALNLQYRGKERPTNVLSFPFEFPAELPPEMMAELMPDEALPEAMLGDLAICADVVKSEAQQQNKKLHDHWAHMVVHGCLHLLGYDHIKDQEAEVMEALEVSILSKLKISDPYHIDN